MRLVDADEIDYSLGSSDEDIYCRYTLEEAPTVDAIPIKWLEKRYPIHGTYGTESYFRKAYAIFEVIKEWREREENEID